MIRFEDYKSHLKLLDKYNLHEIDVDKSIVYNDRNKNFNCAYNKEKSCKRPLAAAILGLKNTDIPLPENLDYLNTWTDADAQEAFLKTKPKTFLILGKQGTGSYNLGEALSKKINCIHLCPKNIIVDEVEQMSSTGKCLDFNMRHNKVCKFDTIISILKKKMDSPSIKHRGFVISGLPLVNTCESLNYLKSSLHSEESLSISEEFVNELLFNLRKKKSKKRQSSPHSSQSSNLPVEEELEEEHEPEEVEEEAEEAILELPKFVLDSCENILFSSKSFYDTNKSALLYQLKALFHFKPDILIFITCPNNDIVTKRSRKYLYYLNSSNTFFPFPSILDSEIRWPPNYTLLNYQKPFDSHIFNPKYNCKQPINFTKKAIQQICNYKAYVVPFLEEKLKEYDPNIIIKLDGRNSVHQMIYFTLERLLFMPIKPIVIPEPLYLEDLPEEMEEFWKIIEELNVIRSDSINFNRYASAWSNRCPVELKKRRSVQGKPKFAVTFFKHVYLLSSLDAMIRFCRNPRPFLKLKYLEPTCRMIVMGTKSTGKTMISQCLSWIFETPVICYNTFLQNESKKKYDNYAKSILSEIIPIIEDMRFTKWQNSEIERISNINTWFNTVSSILNAYIPLLKEKIKMEEEEADINENVFVLNKFKELRNHLFFLPIDDLKECQFIIKSKNLLKYAPLDLMTETIKPPLPCLGDEDVTQEITAYIKSNDLQKEIEPTPEELMTELIQIIQGIDKRSLKNTGEDYGKFIIDGFPSDPEYLNYLIDANIVPDYTVSIIENREVDSDLIEYYKTVENAFKNYQERYLMSNDVLIKTKLVMNPPPDTIRIDIEIIVDGLINQILNIINMDEGDKTSDTEIITVFTEALNKFRENWDIFKVKLEENFKSFIEVEIENKTDIQIVDEVLLKIRKSYCLPCANIKEPPENFDDEGEYSKDIATYNDPRYLGESNVYCPITFYDYGVLWEGRPDFITKYNNKMYYFAKEEFIEKFQNDVTEYLSYTKPFKKLPSLRICVIGSIGSGKSTVSKIIAKELGVMHIDFAEFLNKFFIPKHFKKIGWQYENNFTDTPIDDEDIVEFQMDEENINMLADILSNEQELRRILYNYLERGSPLLPIIVQSMLKKLWYESPFSNTGIIIDGFPRMTSDVEDMLSCYCIPDVVIELESSSEIAVERMSSIRLKQWKLQLSEAKQQVKNKFEQEKKEWLSLLTKKIVIKLIIDEILGSIVMDSEEPMKNLSAQSTIIDAHPSGSSNVDANLFATYNELIQEYPEPVDESEWEKVDDALERINNRIESIFEAEDENIQTLKDLTEEQKIKTVSVDGKKTFNKVIRQVLSKLKNQRNRTDSFFEQTFVINCDIAEMLLLEGFFLLSKFNKMCPVYIFENRYTIYNPYNISKAKNKIFPIIHRAYIYFISSEDSVKKFRLNPLKYIKDNTIEIYQNYPIKISIIGPPKSGKSKLAVKLAKRYGLVCISKGTALRHILENMDWTELGVKIKSSISQGKCVPDEIIMKAIVVVAMDNRTVTNGIIFDGFPESPYEACELLNNGLFPHFIFDIKSCKESILFNSQNEIYYDILKMKAAYSRPLIEYRFSNWTEKCSRIRDWIHQDTQNQFILNGDNSKWQCFVDAYTIIDNITPQIHYYLANVRNEIVRADMMCISNEMFQKKMTDFKNLCPVCLTKNILRHSGFPTDKKGIVQYKNHFYWVCKEHLNLVLKFPKENLTSKKKTIIPEVPAVLKSININTSLVYENGICVVTYAENLPAQRISSGTSEFAAIYKNRIYLLCSPKCLEKFLAKPHMYYNTKIFQDFSCLPKLFLNNLPHLGYLEQTIGNILTSACCAVNVLRPKYPGLDIRISALLHIALYLKIHNPKVNKSLLPMYLKMYRIFEARSKLITSIGLRLRSIDNPFAKYPKCCGKIKGLRQIDSGTVKKPSSVDSDSTSLYSELNKVLE